VTVVGQQEAAANDSHRTYSTAFEGESEPQSGRRTAYGASGSAPTWGLEHDLRGAWFADGSRGGRFERVSRGPAPLQSITLPILMYHHIRPIDARISADRYARELTLPADEFDVQLRYLTDRGFKTITMADLALQLQGRKDLPTRAVILTFDDGYDDNYLYAYPLLRRYQLSGTFFITTGLIDLDGYMTFPQLRIMVGGGMEAGSHLLSHSDLTQLSVAQRDKELRESKRELEAETGRAIQALSYPGGAFSPEVVAATRKAGYTTAVTTQYGAVHDGLRPLELPRIRISGWENLASFRSKIDPLIPSEEPTTR